MSKPQHTAVQTQRGRWVLALDAETGTATVVSFERLAGPERTMRGLGDALARATEAVGIKPCAGCKKRQEALNRAVPFRKASDPGSGQAGA